LRPVRTGHRRVGRGTRGAPAAGGGPRGIPGVRGEVRAARPLPPLPAGTTAQTAQGRTLMPVPEGLRAQVISAGRQVAGDLAGSHEAQGSGYLLKVVQPALLGLMDGLMHALPFLIPHLQLALVVAYFVVGIELVTIAFIRNRYFSMSFWLSFLQVIVGGMLVFLAGVLIGNS